MLTAAEMKTQTMRQNCCCFFGVKGEGVNRYLKCLHLRLNVRYYAGKAYWIEHMALAVSVLSATLPG